MLNKKIKIFGLDLDNTVIDYTESYINIAKRFKLKANLRTRNSIRNYFKKTPEGEFVWQKFQSELYSTGMSFAKPAHGLLEFLHKSKANNIKICIISHKTEFTTSGINLRSHSIRWLETNNIIPNLINIKDTYFCDSQEDKIKKIEELNCDYFADDLVSILESQKFPIKVGRILVDLENCVTNYNKNCIKISDFSDLLDLI
jgi:hypothetical protein